MKVGRKRLNQGELTTLYIEKIVKEKLAELPGDTFSHKLARVLEEHSQYRSRFGELTGAAS